MRIEVKDTLKQAVKTYKNTGNEQAFNTIYEESKNYIYVCIRKIASGNYNEEDSVQDIFMDTMFEISRSIGQLDDLDAFLAWAGTIATRKCYAFFSKNRRELLFDEDGEGTFAEIPDDEAFIPENIIDNQEKQRLIREIIDRELTVMQKICVIDYYYNDMKQSEIAIDLGIPENTVMTNLSRAKAKIKDAVLRMEKENGTKLYSVAPFMLFLFRNEIQSVIVPAKWTIQIQSTETRAAATNHTLAGSGTTPASKSTSLIGKIATASVKAKVIGAVVGVAVCAMVAGTIYMANNSNGEQRNQSVEETVQDVTREVNTSENTTVNQTEQTYTFTATEYDQVYTMLVYLIGAARVDKKFDTANIEDQMYFLQLMMCENEATDIDLEVFIPKMAKQEEPQYGGVQFVADKQVVSDYLSSVFTTKVDVSKSAELQGDNIVFMLEWEDASSSITANLPMHVQEKGGVCTIEGTATYAASIGATGKGSYSYILKVEKNASSPFAFKIVSFELNK